MGRSLLYGVAVMLVGLMAVTVASCQPREEGAAMLDQFVLVRAKTKVDQPWKEYQTLPLQGVAGFTPGAARIPLSEYGGRLDMRQEARGFTYVTKLGDRWWLVDPEGCPLLHIAVVSVSPGRSRANTLALRERFGDETKWAAATTQMLRSYAFNGAGAWSSADLIRKSPTPVLYTCIWNFMSAFAKSRKLTHVQPGHTGYVDDCIPVFHPQFEAFCNDLARGLAAYKDDPWCLGHFSDNEMPFPRDLLDRNLKLDPRNRDMAPNCRAAREWLAKRKGSDDPTMPVTDEDREAFRGYVADRYFDITTRAIRKHDPNHLCLGSRFHGAEKTSPAVFQAAGKYLNVVSVNYYGVWTPLEKDLANWVNWSGRPVIITEWYTKGSDVPGLKNTTGAGWIVPTQEDRGLFYQNYTLALLRSRVCVGWHWFKYMDNDPEDLSTDPSNRDSNKGIVNLRYEGYPPLLDCMKALNANAYALADHFDSQSEQ